MKTEEQHYQSALKKLYKIYKSSAKERDINFNLDLGEFETIVAKKHCTYCGDKITRTVASRSTHFSQRFVFGGMNRIKNDEGYSVKNCVTCCESCNRAKMNLSLEDFIKRSIAIAARAAMILDGYK